MFIMDLLLLALGPVIFPDPGMERVFIHPKVTGSLCDRLIGLDGQFDSTLLEFGGITFHRCFTHRTHLSRGTIVLVPVCPVEYSHIKMTVRQLTRGDKTP